MRVLPDTLSAALMARVTRAVRGDLDRSAMEAITGERRDVTRAVNGQLGQVHRLRRTMDEAQAVGARLAVAQSRMTTAAAALSAMRTSTEGLGLEALNAAVAGGATGVGAFAETARETLKGVASQLNTRFDGRSLFAGAAADGPAVAPGEAILAELDTLGAGLSAAGRGAAIEAYFAPGGGYDAAYRGASTDAGEAALPDGGALPGLPRADDEAVRTLLKGLALIAAAGDVPETQAVALASRGAEALRAAGEGLTVWEARLGHASERIAAAEARWADEVRVTGETLARLTGRDGFEAASEVQQLESRLEAAYALTARLSRLTLTSFLR